MEFVRSLPATGAAPELAGPVVDLATANRLPGHVARDVHNLAGELLTEVATSVDKDTVQLRIRCEPESVRLEVQGEAERAALPDSDDDSDGGRAERLVRIDDLADRWGLSHRGRDYCLWAEKLIDADTSFKLPRRLRSGGSPGG